TGAASAPAARGSVTRPRRPGSGPAAPGRCPAGPSPPGSGPRTGSAAASAGSPAFRPGSGGPCGRPAPRRPPAPRPAAPGNTRPATAGWTSWLLPAQQVAFAPASQDEGRVEALVDFIAQVADVDVHDVGRALVLLVVEVLPDHRPADDPAAVEGEELQQGVLARRQVDGLAGAADGAGGGVDLQVEDADDRVLHLVAPADQRPQPGEQLLQ